MSKDKKEYQLISINDVVENTWNPNVMSKYDYEGLKASLDKDGGNYKQPILVRKLNDKFEVVDGAHRFKAMKELGFDDIVAIELDLSDEQARVKTIAMNKLRGVSDPVKLSELISELKKTYHMTEEEIQGELSMEQKEMQELSALTDFDMSFMMMDVVEMPEIAELIPVKFNFTNEEAEEIYRVAKLTQKTVKELILEAMREAAKAVHSEPEVVSVGPLQDFDVTDITF